MTLFPNIFSGNLEDKSIELKDANDAFKLLKELINDWTLAPGRNTVDLARFIKQEPDDATTTIITKILQKTDRTLDPIEPHMKETGSSGSLELDHKPVVDVGSAIGYLFSRISGLAASTDSTDPEYTVFDTPNLLSILQMYAKHLSASAAGEKEVMPSMSCVLVAGTHIYFGSALMKQSVKVAGTAATSETELKKLKNDAEAELKNNAQAYRYTLLKDAPGIKVPPLCPKLELDIVNHLTNAYIIHAGLSTTEDFGALLCKWKGTKPAGLEIFQYDKKQSDRDGWTHRRYFAWLCLQLLRTLVGYSNETSPLIIQRRKVIQGPTYDTWRERIVRLLMSGEIGVPPNAVLNVREELEHQPQDPQVITHFKLPQSDYQKQLRDKFKPDGKLTEIDVTKDKAEELLNDLFKPERVFVNIVNLATRAGGQKYGHCAETYPVLYFSSLDGPPTEGLSLKPPNPDKTEEVFALPCINCRSLLRILNTKEGYNKYFEKEKEKKMTEEEKKAAKKAEEKKGQTIEFLLDEYLVGSKTNWSSP